VDPGNRQQVLRELQAALGTTQKRSSMASQPSIPTAELVDKYLESRHADLADDSFLTHSGVLHSFARVFPELPMDPEVIEHYMAERRGRGKGSLSADYRRLLHSILTRLYSFAHKRYDAPNVMEKVDRPAKGKAKESDYLTLDLLKLLLAAIHDDRLRAYVYLCVGQGLRPEEPLRLNIEDIFPDRLRVKGKERTEWVPLLAEVREALARVSTGRLGGDPLFVGYTTNSRLGRKQVYNVIHDLFREAGIAGLKAAPKTLRHTFCTLAQSAGCDRASTEALMRHHTSNVTDFYTHLSAEERLRLLRAKLEQYSPLRQANGQLPLNLHKSTG
jgi:integrase